MDTLNLEQRCVFVFVMVLESLVHITWILASMAVSLLQDYFSVYWSY